MWVYCRDYVLVIFIFTFVLMLIFILMFTFILMLIFIFISTIIAIVLPFSTIIINTVFSPQQQSFLSLSQLIPFFLFNQLIFICFFSLIHIGASFHYCYSMTF